MPNRIRGVALVSCALLVLAGCGRARPAVAPVHPPASPVEAQLSGPYLGQRTPGLKPEIFAPGIVSDPATTEYSGTFSPDGNEYYFYRFSADSPDKLLFTKLADGVWTTPQELALSGGYAASEPYIPLDNTRLYFMWERPVPEGQTSYVGEGGYYVAQRTSTGWSDPKYAGQGMFLSSSRDGQMYTTDMSSVSVDGKTFLARVATKDGLFASYERLAIQPRSGYQAHPCIAPDGSYLIFDVEEGNHLFISFRTADGSWGEAIDLTEHGIDLMAGGASVSPDGRYLFFGLRGDIWWVDAKVVEQLKPN